MVDMKASMSRPRLVVKLDFQANNEVTVMHYNCGDLAMGRIALELGKLVGTATSTCASHRPVRHYKTEAWRCEP